MWSCNWWTHCYKLFNEVMNKKLVKSLYDFADVVANRFSKKDREGNVNNESFKVYEVIPTSDQTAIVFFQKSTQKLKALMIIKLILFLILN